MADKAAPYLERIPQALSELIQAMQADAESVLTVTFHLDNRTLTAVEGFVILSGVSYELQAVLEADVLSLVLLQGDDESLDRRQLTVKTVSDGKIYQEELVLRRTVNGVQLGFSVDYSWDPVTGDMDAEILKGGKSYAFRLNLRGERQSFTVNCQQFEVVWSLLSGKEHSRPAICTLTISPGEAVQAISAYKNLSDWSVEDFYLLLTRLGSLAGVKLP